ncbi:hypothetical protein [Bacillus infantis]|uniref:hypothetical protein n=1 Tax=Bacillus infantis TaxID=324767 RepID=UPI003CF40238
MDGKRKRKRKKKSRSKVWKYIFISFLVLLIGGAGTAYYFLKIKTYDVADAKVEEIVEQEYDIVLPGEDSGSAGNGSTADSSESSDGGTAGDTSSNPDAAENSSNSGTAGKQASAVQNGSKQTASTSQSAAAAGNKNAGTKTEAKKAVPVTVASIKQKYQPTFESLESQANDRLNSLVSQAVNEYHSKREKDESISVTYFYRKYSEAGRALESSTDGAFHYVYAALEQDLKKNGFSSSHAETFRTKYENAKKTRENALLDKAKSAL